VIASTHIAFASTLYLGGAALFEYNTDLIGWALAAAASLLSDAGLPMSKIGRALFWLSARLEKRFGHHTITHSIIAIGALALLASPLFLVERIYFWCVLGGYWSHLWIDMLNIRGADLFWPSPVRLVMPGNRNWCMEVGSKAEMVLLTHRAAAEARRGGIHAKPMLV
jgi:inner membrane protein